MQIGGAYSSYKLRLLINDFTAGFFMQRVCSLTVYLLHLHYLSVIYFYEQKVFGGALIWQLKPQRKKRFCTYFS